MRRHLVALPLGALVAVAVACGARTGLDDDAAPPALLAPDAAVPAEDARKDAGADAQKDAPADAQKDAPADAFLPPDAPSTKIDCTDTSTKWIYVVTVDEELFYLDPSTGNYQLVAKIGCPVTFGATPFSMAVNRKGTAFVLYSNGALFRVSTKTGKCEPTPFASGQLGFGTFGMGFATIAEGPAEELYIAATNQSGNNISALGIIDTTTYKVKKVGDFVPPQTGAELTGTGDGRLFGFLANANGAGTKILQLDKTKASVLAEVKLPSVTLGEGWAFAFWGGDFYLFTSPGTPSVTRYDPGTGAVSQLFDLPSTVVGAGVSTCAPED
ncbi:MAG: hypothetical protein IT374_25450 [Polyangiaceae bacterium]|nr:hypothetical protein [Polyangiaceae bacterium]